MSQVATVKLGWAPSTSAGVVSQSLSVAVAGGAPAVTALHPDAAECVPFDVPVGSPVHCELTCSNGALSSAPVVLDFTVPEVVAPAAPAGLAFSVLGYKEVASAS